MILALALLVPPLATGLTGCANPETRQAQAQAAQAAAEQKDDSQCRANGVVPGSEAYNQCRAKLADARAADEALQQQHSEAFQQVLGRGSDALSGH